MALHHQAVLYAQQLPILYREQVIAAFKAGYALATQENPLYKQCLECDRLFKPKSKDHRYCSSKCRNRMAVREWRKRNGLGNKVLG